MYRLKLGESVKINFIESRSGVQTQPSVQSGMCRRHWGSLLLVVGVDRWYTHGPYGNDVALENIHFHKPSVGL